jgi:hypothetical protein
MSEIPFSSAWLASLTPAQRQAAISSLSPPDPGWEPIGWDEALDLTGGAMRRVAERHGPQAVAFIVSSPSTTTFEEEPAGERWTDDDFHCRKVGAPQPPVTRNNGGPQPRPRLAARARPRAREYRK